MSIKPKGSVLPVAIIFLALAPSAALAKKPCAASDGVATKHWKKYGELAKRYGCANVEEVPSAGLEAVRRRCEKDPMTAAKIAAGMATFYEKTYGDLPAKLKLKQPARLRFAAQHGSLVSTLGRTWIAPEPSEDDEATVVFRKLDGGSKASIEVCEHTADGRSKVVWSTTVVPGGKSDVGREFSKKLSHVRGSILSVTIDAKSVAKKLEYTIRLKRPGQGRIDRVNQAAKGGARAPGFADIHNHQLSNFAWAGAWINQAVDQPMKPCTGEDHGVLKLTFAGKDELDGAEFRRKHPERKNPRDWFHHLDTTHPHSHMELLEQAHARGLNLMVMSAVAHREFILTLLDKNKDDDLPLDETDAIKLQLRAAKALAAKYPWYQIALDPASARQIIAQGKLAVVLGVEYSDVMPKKFGDWREQLEELYLMGVRSFVMSHERDSQFSGFAYHHGINIAVAQALSKPLKKGKFKGQNPLGLTPTGRQLMGELARRGMLIEIDHASRNARRDIFNVVSSANAGPLAWYPLYVTHTRFEALMPTPKEFEAWVGKKTGYADARQTGGYDGTGETPATDEDALWIRATGGIFGMRTGPNAQRTYAPAGVKNSCHTSSRSLAQLYGYAVHRFGLAVSIGSDFSGPTVVETGPRFGPEACSKLGNQQADDPKRDNPTGTSFDRQGLGHVGLEPDLIADLGKLGMDTGNLESSVESFLRMWERAHEGRRQKLDAAGYAALMGIDEPDDVRDGDVLARGKRAEAGTTPSCPAGFRYEKRSGLNKDRCVKTEIVTGEAKCKLALTDKRANWRIVARPKVDICESTKGKKKTKKVGCDAGFSLEVRAGKDLCTKSKEIKAEPSCPSGMKLERSKGLDVCK